MKLMKLFSVCLVFNITLGMENRKIRILNESKQKLREMGDYYDFEPSENGPLDEETVMNPFWKQVKSLPTNKEKIDFLNAASKKVGAEYLFDYPWALMRMRYAAFTCADISDEFSMSPVFEANRKNDIELIKFLATHMKFHKPNEQYIVFSVVCTTIEKALIFSNAEIIIPQWILHSVMSASHEPALVDFYRNKGACPLMTDKEEIPQSQWPRFNCGMPVLYYPAKLPIVDLAQNTADHTQFSDVINKFNQLTNNLSNAQLISMFEHNKQYGFDVISVLKKKDHAHAKALLQVIENRYAELKK